MAAWITSTTSRYRRDKVKFASQTDDGQRRKPIRSGKKLTACWRSNSSNPLVRHGLHGWFWFRSRMDPQGFVSTIGNSMLRRLLTRTQLQESTTWLRGFRETVTSQPWTARKVITKSNCRKERRTLPRFCALWDNSVGRVCLLGYATPQQSFNVSWTLFFQASRGRCAWSSLMT